ncbi:MAG: penicillin acylase family protein [Alphaproteobacteria bacterium]
MAKILRALLYLIPVILVALGLGAWYVGQSFQRALPSYVGQVDMRGLSSSVRVYRDEHGVPHIFADSMNDAVRTLGYIHASERLFQMEMQRRAGQGRLAEAVGSDMLGVDKFIRTLGLYPLAQSSFDAMSGEAQAFFQAYADGVNAWLQSHSKSLPPEFLITGITPEAWKPADSVVWGKLMGLQLSHNYKLEMLRENLLQAKTKPEQMTALFPPLPGDSPITTSPHSRVSIGSSQILPPPLKTKAPLKKKSENEIYEKLGRITNLDHGASNEWVIAGSRTTTGKPILANDPHLGLEAPILWFLARIVTPDLSLKGATVPGLPIVLLGQNNHIAWGLTTTDSDVQDLFIETIDPKNTDNYLTPNGSEAFRIREEVIQVKNGRDVTLKVRSTRHGPVMSDIDSDMQELAGSGKVMALSFTGLGDRDPTSEVLMHLNRAFNWEDFTQALKQYQAPPQNIVYADDKGNIGFINPGLVPVRKKGAGLTPSDGASGDYDWIGMVPFSQLPQLYNPASGFVFNANNAVTSPGQVYFYGVDWEEPYRAMRIQQYFDTTKQHSLDVSSLMQGDHVSLVAKAFLPYLINLKVTEPQSVAALDLLKGWNGDMDKDRPEPLIFDAWLYKLHKLMLVDHADNPLKERGPYAATSIAYILANHLTAWCGDDFEHPAPNCDAIMAKALDEALDMLEDRESGGMSSWRWGNEHITELKHKVYKHIPFLSAKSDLSVASSGDFYTVDRGGSFSPKSDNPFVRNHGGGFRGVYDLANPDQSRFMITTGESGHILSPYYGNLVKMWNDVEYITLSGTAEDLAARQLPELVFHPQN